MFGIVVVVQEGYKLAKATPAFQSPPCPVFIIQLACCMQFTNFQRIMFVNVQICACVIEEERVFLSSRLVLNLD